MSIDWNAISAVSAAIATFLALCQTIIAARIQARAHEQVKQAQAAALEAVETIGNRYGATLRTNAEDIARVLAAAAEHRADEMRSRLERAMLEIGDYHGRTQDRIERLEQDLKKMGSAHDLPA